MIQILYCIGLFIVGFLMGRNCFIRTIGFVLLGVLLIITFYSVEIKIQYLLNKINLNLLFGYLSGFSLGIYFRYLVRINLKEA